MESSLWPNSQNWNLIIGLDAYWIYKHARKLSQHSKLSWPPLGPTLSKPYDGFSLLSSFLEFKFDHKFGCPFDEQACMQTFETFQNIFTPFSPALAKPHNEVSRLTSFSKLKFNHRFKCAFGRQECMPTFTMLRAIFSIFKPIPNKTTQWSLRFDQILKIETWS